MVLNSNHVGSIDESTFLPLAAPVMFSSSSFLASAPTSFQPSSEIPFPPIVPTPNGVKYKKKKTTLNVWENVRSTYTK